MEDGYFGDNYDRKDTLHFESKVVHGAHGCDPFTGAVSFPIFQTSTFRHRDLGHENGYYYSRLENPTRQELERSIALLEEGVAGFAFSSGQAANMALFGLLSPKDHVILSDDLYGGTYRICESVFRKMECEFSYVDMSDIERVRAAVRPNTRMIFIETPTNPMMKVTDIQKASEIAKEIGALLVVDNTFATPYFQKPIVLGADIVVHSGTKYLSGHNDVLAGFVVVNTEELAAHFEEQIKTRGNGLAPFDSWLVMRGMKTLALRMNKHNENAKIIAQWLRQHKKVEEVYYVGFEDHLNYDVTVKQTKGFGGMISFRVDCKETAMRVLSKVELVLFAESLGGTETLVTYPLTQTHESIPEDVRNSLGINECLLRLSVGIEHVDDIIADLEQALGDE